MTTTTLTKTKYDAELREALKDLPELCNELVVQQKSSIDKFLTVDADMIKMKETIGKLSRSSITILIIGESGVGKELIANAIHEISGVKGKFVGVNCAGVPGELLESEFFGSKKGAFTGSYSDRSGLIAEADGGTLFLDEIGDMPPLLQCKLLRVLQDKSYRRLGDTKEIPVTCRFVSATNYPLESLTNPGSLVLRKDLFYRLAGSIVNISPLRLRRGDIKLIAESEGLSLYPEYWDKKDWHGNIRELINKITEHKLLNNTL